MTDPAGHFPFGRPDSFAIPNFWEPNYWEPTVQIALKDYCRPGDVVFDVGANAGALSMVMSRHVGPRGVVCSFEASPRIIDKTQWNLVNAGCNNVNLYYRAVYHTSHQTVELFPGTHLNDSIYNNYGTQEGAKYLVETISLDDFVAATGLMPSFIKMDIEGAEFDALMGAKTVLSQGKPGMILEQSPADMRCHQLLVSYGYIAIDLADYRRINSADDFTPGVGVANILFIHESKSANDPYIHVSNPVKVAELSPDLFEIAANGSLSLRNPIELPAGRYLCKAHFTADGKDNEIYAGVDSDITRLMRYHTYTSFMANSYSDWVFSLNGPRKITPYIQFLRGSDPTFQWNGATIYNYESFNTLAPAIIY